MGKGRLQGTTSKDSWLLSQPDAALPRGQEQNLQLPGSGSDLARLWEEAGAACRALRLVVEGEWSRLEPVLCSGGASQLQSRPRRSARCRAEPRSTHLQPPELAGQVQGGFLCLVDEAGVGLVLEQHL